MRTRLLLAGLAGLLLSACDSDSTPPPGVATFEVEVNKERFYVAMATEAQAAEARTHLASGREGVLHGALVRGNGGFNTGYRWHLDPASVSFPDAAIEVCDGRPRSDVESDLDYWINTVRYYCPWGAKIVREVPR
ncbi:MAG TPA: hypothetical protein VD948_01545 [Rhodothermales bacterium]|nr:hypothetical protein [Rhodothermales bacterium]